MEVGSETTASSANKRHPYRIVGRSLYNLVSFIEGYDQQVLSMCMRAFELTLGFSQSQLSTLATVSTMSRMGCCLIWGRASGDGRGFDCSRFRVAIQISQLQFVLLMFPQIVFLRFLHGFGFACVYPVQQKIVSDSTDSENSNKAEGAQDQGTKAEGTPNQGKKAEGGQNQGKKGEGAQDEDEEESKEASRYVWILFAIGIVFGMEKIESECTKNSEDSEGIQELITGAINDPFTRGTTWLLILTLFIAEAPMCAFNYMTIYLQYLGVSDTMAGVAIAITLIGGAAGSGAGGEAIKKIAQKAKGYGELGSGLAVMAVRMVVCLLFFLGKPPCGKLLWYHYVELATLGGTLVTVGGVDRALLKSAIEKKFQATASAMVRTISGIASSVILFQVCAYLTEKVFGYVPSRESFETMAAEVKERNAEALRKSMMYIILAGTALNTLCYLVLFATYQNDRGVVKDKNKAHKAEKEKKAQEKAAGKKK
ncbi:major facilitator superfamily member protein [Babesia ovata]|uniref:Major facilitator superfamily member protein n=1 Tax=Babesia ovata TaxID=189622 RepID=A0A2H6KHK1_9APIC|nr:major facilitator superfamily member protein [Babesia ovata]GBE62468.1 major facilitator superfamily member protein [Babesia ovata]